jgi:hypothetical protein
LKLPLLLTQFLYQNKKLNLPGIGTFTLDPGAVLPDEADKNQHVEIQGVEFSNIPVFRPDDDLIEFIRLHTGKMKSLAEADLESYLTLGIQLLNIGKPFYFEGIGAITKSQEGKYEFTPGEFVSLKLEDTEIEKREKQDKRKSVFEEKHDEYQPQSNGLRKFLLVLGIICGLGLIGWGGYTLYKRNTYQENPNHSIQTGQDSIQPKTDSVPVTDTQSTTVQTDSLSHKKPDNNTGNIISRDSVFYKYIILATDRKNKAIRRYQQLLSYDLKIKMDTKDSSFFKLYFTFPALVKDTSRIKDSLDRVYATKVVIEK